VKESISNYWKSFGI